MFWMSDRDAATVQVQYRLPTHPIPGRSTRRAAVPQQIQPQWWACAGRFLHTASRSSWKLACIESAQPGPYSSPDKQGIVRLKMWHSLRSDQEIQEHIRNDMLNSMVWDKIEINLAAHLVAGIYGFVIGQKEWERHDGKDGVQDEGQKHVLVEGDSLTAKTPERKKQTQRVERERSLWGFFTRADRLGSVWLYLLFALFHSGEYHISRTISSTYSEVPGR